MDDDELLEAIRVAVRKQRGYADFYHWHDKRQKEAGILESFEEGARRLQIELTNTQLEKEGRDPPDAWTLCGTRKIALELTEFVDASLIGEQKRTGVAQSRTWNHSEFSVKLESIITGKDHGGFGKLADFWLVIHCDEPALTSSMIAEYCEESGAFETSGLDRCFVLLSYDPQIVSYPVIEVSVRRAS